MVFDKTGTLTRGQMRLTEVVPTNGKKAIWCSRSPRRSSRAPSTRSARPSSPALASAL
ncbi:hypothetical protein [Mycobacterium szulgai]|uniref:hypothetical protein n=1 Tax=Mycobacterium szulgai TaxID=1787 RepID=UPI0035568D14